MSNKLSKKRRLARAHTHRVVTSTPDYVPAHLADRGWVREVDVTEVTHRLMDDFDDDAIARQEPREVKPLTMAQVAESDDLVRAADLAPPSNHATGSAVDGNLEQPTRAKCSCGTRQKVRKDGTFGKHTVALASDPLTPVECNGIGARWDA